MKEFDRLVDIMEKLRAPNGCPWDALQTHDSIARCAVEEAYELVDAISGKRPENIKEELGDLLLQVVFHAEMARQSGEFTIEDVVNGISEKLLNRHPHVFGDAKASTAEEVRHSWEELKKREKTKNNRRNTLDGVPLDLPALLLARKAVSALRRKGLVSEDISVHLRNIRKNLDLIKSSEQPGEVIAEIVFSASVLAQLLNIDTETALRKMVLDMTA